MEQVEQDYKYMVVTRCFTFNHAPYIVDAMNGFTMQETTFPVITLIVDDASTDGEPEIIKKYLADHFQTPYRTEETDDYHLICANHKTNSNSTFVVFLLKYNHYSINKSKYIYFKEWLGKSKYIALCEGDDYWICTDKIQSQVNYLEFHTDSSLCTHRIRRFDQDSKIMYEDRFGDLFSVDGTRFGNNAKVWLAETSSVLYRASSDVEYNAYPGMKRDNVHIYFILKTGYGYCLNKVMSVYRQHRGGVYSKQGVKEKYIQGSYKAMKELYEIEKTTDAKRLFYSCYLYTLWATRGRILFLETFDIKKVLSCIIRLPFLIFRKHPLYQPIKNI